MESGVRRREHGEEKVKQLGGLMMIINAIIWFVGLVFLLSNWGIEVTPIIAGLGIGGIAVALAAQNILGDLFSYFVIFFDRPFEQDGNDRICRREDHPHKGNRRGADHYW
jgi:small-conductance mechanosensitive channel